LAKLVLDHASMTLIVKQRLDAFNMAPAFDPMDSEAAFHRRFALPRDFRAPTQLHDDNVGVRRHAAPVACQGLCRATTRL
jgi:hypothetical protein